MALPEPLRTSLAALMLVASAATAPAAAPKAVAVLSHPLNMRPAKMGSIARLLEVRGAAVVPAMFAGHRGEIPELRGVTRERWLGDMREAFREGMARAEREGVPLHFVGYSLGATVGLDLLASEPELRADRLALLAPAIALHRFHAFGLRRLRRFRNLALPSWSPPDHRVYDRVSMSAYGALLDSIASLERAGYAGLDRPTLVLIDPGDEAVSAKGVRRAIRRHGLRRWQVTELEHSGATAPGGTRHLLSGPEALGAREWARLEALISGHLGL